MGSMSLLIHRIRIGRNWHSCQVEDRDMACSTACDTRWAQTAHQRSSPLTWIQDFWCLACLHHQAWSSRMSLDIGVHLFMDAEFFGLEQLSLESKLACIALSR